MHEDVIDGQESPFYNQLLRSASISVLCQTADFP